MANKHPRVNLHSPGPGVGGHCLAVDPYFIVAKSPDLAKIINLSRETNVSMPHYVADNVQKLTESIEDAKVAVFGVTYKGNVDDMRESPAVEIAELLLDRGVNISVHDGHVEKSTSSRFELVSKEEALQDADLVLVLVDHNEFKTLDFAELQSTMRRPMIFDTRNIVKPEGDAVTVVNYGNLYKYTKETNLVL